MNFTWESLESAQIALTKLFEQAAGFKEINKHPDIDFEREFLDAASQDLNMPKALSVMWEMLGSQDLRDDVKAATLFKMDKVLGLNIEKNAKRIAKIPANILKMVEEREKLRRQKKFTQADHMRNRIEKMGYTLEDQDDGPKIMRKI
jgi:cysteinyl-tRNA synthetase